MIMIIIMIIIVIIAIMIMMIKILLLIEVVVIIIAIINNPFKPVDFSSRSTTDYNYTNHLRKWILKLWF